MFAVQLIVSALVWAATVYALVRHRDKMLSRMVTVPQGRRALFAVGLLLLSVVVLACGMATLALGGLTPQGLTLAAWAAITVAGAAFVGLQSTALVPLLLNATRSVTSKDARSSDKVDDRRL